MQELNLNEIDQVSGGLVAFWRALSFISTASTGYDIASWYANNADTSVYAEDRGAGAWG